MSRKEKTYRLATCNIEGSTHTPEVIAFLREYSPDIVCLQEAHETEVRMLARLFNYFYSFRTGAFLRTAQAPSYVANEHIGIAILARSPMLSTKVFTYAGDHDHVPDYVHENPDSRRREVLSVELESGLHIATTHFTYSPRGEINELQRRDIEHLLEYIPLLGECILAGDFNAPRPNPLYHALIRYFTDCMPHYFVSSIDPYIHPRGQSVNVLIDYIFRTPQYRVDNVELVPGVSDHKAVVAAIHV